MSAGLTHPEASGAAGARAGVSFFVPDEISARAREWGWPDARASDSRTRSATSRGPPGDWLRVVRHRGLGAAGDVYQAVLANRVGSPAEAHVIDVTGDGGR